MRQHKRAAIALGVMALVWMSTSVALAQGGVITLDDSEIKGRIQKPEAFYILSNANLSYENLELKPSFLEEIKASVEDEPF